MFFPANLLASTEETKSKTRMWADAQRDSSPAKYRWRHLPKFYNSTPCTTSQFGWHPGDSQTSCKVWLASGEQRRCSNEGKMWNQLKFAGVPQANEMISAARVLKFTIL